MQFPFITRAHHQDSLQVRDEEIARLKAELRELQQERKQLMDTISLKSVGFQIFGTVNLPKDRDEEEPEPRQYSPEKDSAEPMVRKPEEAPIARARDVVKRAERENLQAAEKKRQDSEHLIEQAREAVLADIEAAKQRGYASAEASDNGNRNR